MFASTLESIGYCTKNIPTLTNREPSLARTFRAKLPNNHVFESAYESVLSIKKQLARIYQFRVELLLRDVQDIFTEHREFCETVLRHATPQAMFEHYDRDCDSKLNEEQQMAMFTHLLTILYHRKEELIEGQWYREHATMLHIIRNIEEELPALEKVIRQRITQMKLEYIQRKKKKALSEYEVEAQKSQKQFLHGKEERMRSLRQRQQKELKSLEQTFADSNPQRLYRARPSKTLREAKDLTLLERLAPYRQEKKRQYECEQLNNTIADSIEKEQARINKTIQVHKNLERRSLRQSQRRKLDIEEDRERQRYNQLLLGLQQERRRVEYREQNSARTLMQSDRREANDRMNWIGKAAKAQHARADSLNIARIVMQHRDVLQFNSSIEKLATLVSNQSSEAQRDYRYFGSESIQSARKLLSKSSNYTLKQEAAAELEATLVKRPGKHQDEPPVKYQEPAVPTMNTQRSLTDLYDQKLNLLC